MKNRLTLAEMSSLNDRIWADGRRYVEMVRRLKARGEDERVIRLVDQAREVLIMLANALMSEHVSGMANTINREPGKKPEPK